jgi:acetyl-CoA carboxylase biotin carboxyl carrier protein
MGRRIELIAEVTGTVWKIERAVGDRLAEGDPLVIVESMKMEIPIEAPCAGKLIELRCAETEPVQEGEVVAIVEMD